MTTQNTKATFKVSFQNQTIIVRAQTERQAIKHGIKKLGYKFNKGTGPFLPFGATAARV